MSAHLFISPALLQEVPGEDPFLTGEYAMHYIRGFQEGPDKRWVDSKLGISLAEGCEISCILFTIKFLHIFIYTETYMYACIYYFDLKRPNLLNDRVCMHSSDIFPNVLVFLLFRCALTSSDCLILCCMHWLSLKHSFAIRFCAADTWRLLAQPNTMPTTTARIAMEWIAAPLMPWLTIKTRYEPEIEDVYICACRWLWANRR